MDAGEAVLICLDGPAIGMQWIQELHGVADGAGFRCMEEDETPDAYADALGMHLCRRLELRPRYA